MYATHIFDGLEGWLTHLAFVSQGKLLKGMLLIAHQCKPTLFVGVHIWHGNRSGQHPSMQASVAVLEGALTK